MRTRRISAWALFWSLAGGGWAQPVTLTFTGAFNGQSMPLDSILVMNLTLGGDTMLYAPDTTLVLGLSTGLAAAVHGDGAGFTLGPNHPNPFVDRTTFTVALPVGGRLTVGLADALGRERLARTLDLPAGVHRFQLVGSCGAPSYVWALFNGERRSIAVLGLGEAPGSAVSITYQGSAPVEPVVKEERALFTWTAGDALRYIGHATLSPGIRLGAAIDDTPATDALHTFTLRYGVPCTANPVVLDIEGNSYRTVRIGEQCWTARNLITTTYSNGDPIPEEEDDVLWEDLTSGAYCYYDNNSNNQAQYGKLYNWYTVVDPRNVCPAGWHVPTNADWTVLIDDLGGLAVAGGKLKGTSSLWSPPNAGATNEVGFTGVPGGYRYDWGDFSELGAQGTWWSATPNDPLTAWRYTVFSAITLVSPSTDWNVFGCSVRCVQDP